MISTESDSEFVLVVELPLVRPDMTLHGGRVCVCVVHVYMWVQVCVCGACIDVGVCQGGGEGDDLSTLQHVLYVSQ